MTFHSNNDDDAPQTVNVNARVTCVCVPRRSAERVRRGAEVTHPRAQASSRPPPRGLVADLEVGIAMSPASRATVDCDGRDAEEMVERAREHTGASD